MSSTEKCLAQLESVRVATADPRLAYCSRVRLRRLILSCIRLVASRVGETPPHFPRRVEWPDTLPQDVRSISISCNRLLALSVRLCQPSEPLNSRWVDEWDVVKSEIAELEAALKRIGEAETMV